MTVTTPTGETFWRYGKKTRPAGDPLRDTDLGPDAFGVQPGTVSFELPGKFDVTVTIDHDKETHRPEATSITFARRSDGPAITARHVARKARVGELVRLAVKALSFPSPTGRATEAWTAQRLQQRAAQEQLGKLYGHERGGRSATSKADRAKMVKKAAAAYLAAQKKGRPTTKAVAVACRVSPGLARKLASEARTAGLLPPAGGTTRPKLS